MPIPGDRESALAAIREELAATYHDPERESDNPAEGAPEGEPEAAADDDQATEQVGEPEQGDIRTLADLAKAIGTDPEILYDLEMTLSDNGEKLKLGQIKDKLQDYARREGELEAERAALTQQRQAMMAQAQQIQAIETQYSQAAREAELEMRRADADYQRIDWNKLDELDPGRSANEKQKLLAQYVAAKERLGQAQQMHAQMVQYQTQQARAYHDQETLKVIPEWRDQAKAQEEVREILTWAQQQGFTDAELSQAWDYRFRKTLRDAWMWNRTKAEATRIKPETLKPLASGRSVTATEQTQSREAELVKQAQRTRLKADKLAAARAVLKNSLGQR
jgi:hypothetical protein